MSEVDKDLQDYRMRSPLVEQLSERIKELELRVNTDYNFYKEIMVKDEARIKKLKGAIEKHQEYTTKFYENELKGKDIDGIDEELYKVLDEMKEIEG